MNPPRIKIVSDGHASGTKAYVEDDDGKITYIPNIVRAYWHVHAGSPAQATLDLINVEVDILGEKNETKDD
jgi:hypothetical protein